LGKTVHLPQVEQIRNTKHEIRNNIKLPKYEIQNKLVRLMLI